MSRSSLVLFLFALVVFVSTPSHVFSRRLSHSSLSSLDPLEGFDCQFNGNLGVCTAGSCSTPKIANVCPGSAALQCCLDATSSPLPLPSPSPSPSPSYPSSNFPYSWPYSTGRHIVVDFALQRIRLYDGTRALKEWKTSTGALGIGFTPEVAATPSGKFRVVMKIGQNAPIGMIYEKLTPQGRIGHESDALAHMQTRLLVLDGLDENNRNTRSRSIYIHGTNKESKLGRPASHGCFRMGNQDVIELFNAVQNGVEVWAVPNNAWPSDSFTQIDTYAIIPPERVD